MEPAIQVAELRKSYGDFEAVRGIDFEVATGEVFGLLGPNGAGKTTTVEILEGLRPRTAGRVKVLGYDPASDTRAIKDRIGVCLQSTNLPDKMTVRESLALFGAFYSREVDRDKLLQRLQLWEKRDVFYAKLSGGQKQRVALALALVNDPISELRESKRTILMPTHYIEEAERLCDRVAIVDEGKIIAIGTPRELQAQTLGQSRVEIHTAQPMPAEVPRFEHSEKHTLTEDRLHLTVYSTRPARTLPDLIRWVDQNGIDLEDIHLKKPTLEDVFIELTGKKLRD